MDLEKLLTKTMWDKCWNVCQNRTLCDTSVPIFEEMKRDPAAETTAKLHFNTFKSPSNDGYEMIKNDKNDWIKYTSGKKTDFTFFAMELPAPTSNPIKAMNSKKIIPLVTSEYNWKKL